MTESDLAYLRTAEVTFASLLPAAAGEAPPVRCPGPAAQAPLPQAPAAGGSELARCACGAGGRRGGRVSRQFPTRAGCRARSRHVPAAPKDADSVGALLLEVVAERTGDSADMLNLDMELDTDLGIDSIKKVEILSTVRERVGDVPGDLAAFATLRTLREIAEQYAQPAGRGRGPGPAGLSRPGWTGCSRPPGRLPRR